MTDLLNALLLNESGGQNIPNVDESTSSGQAQGYFQITTGTWDEFGGRQFAPNPLGASYAQQAEIASRIPLKRWDPTTLASMRATGKKIDPNLTLGENLSMNGESFGSGRRAPAGPVPMVMDGPRGQESIQPQGYSTRPQGPIEAAGGGRGADPTNPAFPVPATTPDTTEASMGGPVAPAGDDGRAQLMKLMLAASLANIRLQPVDYDPYKVMPHMQY